jgi:hypothetical protein
MSREANVWVVVADEVFEQIKDKIGDPEYDGILINLVRFLRRQADFKITSKLWKRPTIAGKVRILFSANYGQDDDLVTIKDALDTLSAELGSDFGVAGAWWWDSRQAGTQWEIVDGEPTGNTTGTPMYPINAVQLLKFMPDVWDDSDPPVLIPATELTDVNLIQGQKPRRFT